MLELPSNEALPSSARKSRDRPGQATLKRPHLNRGHIRIDIAFLLFNASMRLLRMHQAPRRTASPTCAGLPFEASRLHEFRKSLILAATCAIYVPV